MTNKCCFQVLLLGSAEEGNAVTSFKKGQRPSPFERLLVSIGEAPNSRVYTFSYCEVTAVIHDHNT